VRERGRERRGRGAEEQRDKGAEEQRGRGASKKMYKKTIGLTLFLFLATTFTVHAQELPNKETGEIQSCRVFVRNFINGTFANTQFTSGA